VPGRYFVVLGRFTTALLVLMDRVCISVARAPITTDLRLTETQFGWVLSAFALGYALFQTPSGIWADRQGPRIVLASVISIWSLCVDIGRQSSGAVSGTMNMARNLGSFVTALAFPYLKLWFGSTTPFFVVGAVLNLLALMLWTRIQPEKRLEEY
jgi:ACS family glucarate transporter-like MFS transporter